jgi:hypothetical protein
LTEALDDRQAEIAILQNLLTINPNNTDWQVTLNNALNSLAELQQLIQNQHSH